VFSLLEFFPFFKPWFKIFIKCGCKDLSFNKFKIVDSYISEHFFMLPWLYKGAPIWIAW